MSDYKEIHDFPINLRLGVPSASETMTVIKFQIWRKHIEKFGMNFMGDFFSVITATDVNPSWTTQYIPTKQERILAAKDETGIDLHAMKLKMDYSSKLVKTWKFMAPRIVSFILKAMTDDAIKLVERYDKDAWERVLIASNITEMLKLIQKSQTTVSITNNNTTYGTIDLRNSSYEKKKSNFNTKPNQKFVKDMHDLDIKYFQLSFF